jgi:hypothetical protein
VEPGADDRPGHAGQQVLGGGADQVMARHGERPAVRDGRRVRVVA